jgi:hypothetical protein
MSLPRSRRASLAKLAFDSARENLSDRPAEAAGGVGHCDAPLPRPAPGIARIVEILSSIQLRDRQAAPLQGLPPRYGAQSAFNGFASIQTRERQQAALRQTSMK